jgi:4-amino-4-deoxy-L-arabinose transferase-like glycosyltransferase
MADSPELPSSAPSIRRRTKSDWPWIVAVLILIAISVAGIARSWTALSATIDEPVHIWCGIEWLQNGMCGFDLQHPPLGRMVVALGPYLRGLRSPAGTGEQAIAATLHSAGTFRSNIALARSGNLAFFLLACVFVFLWARHVFGASAAAWAVVLFAALPAVLGHAALATNDMACCATVIMSLYAFVRCVEDPSGRRLILLGTALALAFLSKFSSVAFLAACFLSAFAYFVVADPRRRAAWPLLPVRLAIVSGVALLLLWAGYRFASPSLASLYSGTTAGTELNFPDNPLLRTRFAQFPFPLSPVVKGIQELYLHNAQGHESYLFGKARGTGWWYFFPLVLGLKTPIGFLVLTCVGVFVMARGDRLGAWQQYLALIFPCAILLVCMSARINLGVRHILAIYPLLAAIAGYAVSESLARAGRKSFALAALPVLLVGWVVMDSWMARSDYMAYFNQFAGAHPERILAESDLDWGQDLYALSDRLQQLRADHVSIKYFGGTPLEDAGLPPFSVLSPDVPTTYGYVAVSVRYVTLENAAYGSFAWLKDYAPLETVGKSIYLYKF